MKKETAISNHIKANLSEKEMARLRGALDLMTGRNHRSEEGSGVAVIVGNLLALRGEDEGGGQAAERIITNIERACTHLRNTLREIICDDEEQKD